MFRLFLCQVLILINFGITYSAEVVPPNQSESILPHVAITGAPETHQTPVQTEMMTVS